MPTSTDYRVQAQRLHGVADDLLPTQRTSEQAIVREIACWLEIQAAEAKRAESLAGASPAAGLRMLAECVRLTEHLMGDQPAESAEQERAA